MGTKNWDPPLHRSEGALVEFRVVCQLTNRAESGGTLCGITVRRAQHNTAQQQHSTAAADSNTPSLGAFISARRAVPRQKEDAGISKRL